MEIRNDHTAVSGSLKQLIGCGNFGTSSGWDPAEAGLQLWIRLMDHHAVWPLAEPSDLTESR
jgi:hypothetical protein